MTATPKPKPPPILNPRYEGATPEMVGRALLRHPEPEAPQKGEDQSESEA